MGEFPELFKNLKINNYYKYLLYLSGIVFILSLFLDIKNIDVNYVRYVCFWIIIVALGTWIFESAISNINRSIYEHCIRKNYPSSMDGKHGYYKIVRWLVFFSFTIQIIVWIITFIVLIK
ncbi:hypothetical protein CEE44_00675 [Candidatus Woesearchaeota archaeon B3_Woes]|nr:MAG: hypothetical protein CEE44_00675 [Candidatus Woesearchaeota archaeon B3_Woes]